MPVTNAEGDSVYIDLRVGTGHHLLAGAEWEVDEAALMRMVVRKGDVAYDVGAYLGIHSLLLSRLVSEQGRVCAFEPNPQVIPLLEKTLRVNRNIKLYKLALADDCTDATLYVPRTPEYASLADWTVGRVKETARRIVCERRRLDDLVTAGFIPRPDFIKCDVEGAEPLVFKGGRKILDVVDAPILLFESNYYTARGFGFNTTSAMEFLKNLKLPCYSFFKVSAGGMLAEPGAMDHVHANILAVPETKLERVLGVTGYPPVHS